ncbi:MAG TPA: NUDIX hydrolase [Chloroflexota bacterium]|nr:NUDIX hydrolase [Chloroflexota bacterium]
MPSVTCLIPMDDGIILVKRKFDPGRGGWAFPGGFIDAEETASEAALREVKEETNLDVQLEGLLGVYSYVDVVKSGLVVMYQARTVGGTPRSGDDAEEVGCFALGELPPLVFESHRRALARWLSIRAAGGMPPPLL